MRRLAFLVLAGSCYVCGQDVAVLQRGDLHFEGLGAFNLAGGVNKVTTQAVNPVLGTSGYLAPSNNAALGAGAEWFFTRRVGVQMEYEYLAGGTLAFNQDYVRADAPGQISRTSIDAHSSARVGAASVILRMPAVRTPRFVPFVGLGAGVMRTHYKLKQSEVGVVPSRTFSESNHDNDLIASIQGGSRYYFTERLGIIGKFRMFAGPGVRTTPQVMFGFFVKVY